MKERWRRIEALFLTAVQYPSADRAEFLAESCTDDEDLRAEVESLVRVHDSDPSFMETPFLHDAASRLAAQYAAVPDRKSIGGYRLREVIGTGGMGKVYRAWDPRLEREVALKTLHSSSPGEADGRKRLIGEARAAAALSHPNICTVYEVGEDDEDAFIAMELVEGRTLAERVREAPLDVSSSSQTAIQIASALRHAHGRGILHRDLKAANILLASDGSVKVVDFGLSRRFDPKEAEPSSSTDPDRAGIRGTLTYMAPELLRGECADVRSDIWSFGVVLFEMLTGDMPFTGNNELALGSTILNGVPRALPSTVDPTMRQIVARCLEKDVSLRFQSAAEIEQALMACRRAAADWQSGQPAERPSVRQRSRRRWVQFALVAVVLSGFGAGFAWRSMYLTRAPGGRAVGIAPMARAHVAVLPTRLIGRAEAEPHLSIAIPEALTGRLAASSGVRVRPTAAVLAANDGTSDPRALSQLLQVDNLLTSTLWRDSGRYTLTMQLFSTNGNVVIWKREYRLSIEELPRIETAVVLDVATALRLPVGRLAVNRLPFGGATYDEYLRGRAMLVRHSPEALRYAVTAFGRVLERDPTFAPAHAGLALACARLYWQAERGDLENWAGRARTAAERALSLDSSMAEAHLAIAAVYRYNESDWIRTIDESLVALDLDPSLDLPHYNLAAAFYHLGLFALAERAALAGETANPSTQFESLLTRGRAALYAGKFADAESLLENAAGLEGDRPWILGEAYFYNAHPARAEALLRSIFKSGKVVNRTRAGASLASFLAAGGRQAEALQILQTTLTLKPNDHHAAYRIGTAFAQLHQPANAVRWLRRAAESGFPCGAWYANDPLTAPLSGDAAFEGLLRELRSSAEQWSAKYATMYETS